MSRPARSDDSSSTHINESLSSIFIRHSELRIARFPSLDLIFLLYALLDQARDAELYESKIYKKAINNIYRKVSWQLTMQDEIDSLVKNNIWTLISLPLNRKALEEKWVFKLKRSLNDEIVKHKARWVVRDFEQRTDLNYNEIFASVIKLMSYKAIFAMTVALNYELKQMNVKTAFLYGNINEDIYIEQLTSFNKESLVCKLNKALYELKQSSRVWYDTFINFLKFLGFNLLISDYSVFINERIIIEVYVNDILLVGLSKSKI